MDGWGLEMALQKVECMVRCESSGSAEEKDCLAKAALVALVTTFCLTFLIDPRSEFGYDSAPHVVPVPAGPADRDRHIASPVGSVS